MNISALLMALPILFTQAISMHPQEPTAIAQNPNNPSPQAALERLFTTAPIQRQWFADSFLQQIPMPPEQLIQDLQTNLGAFQSAQREGDGYRMTFGRGSLLALIVLNAEGQITGLLFQDIQSNAIALPDAIRQLQALPGETSLLVLAGTTEKAAWNAERSLAVGSTFKLAVLAASRQQIESGQRSWGDVVTLQAQDKSLPSGLLQTWFDGALLTVQTLATLMISQSDNTATDALIRLVGREEIEALAPANRPFLTTREAFVLKSAQNSAVLQRYRSGNTAQRQQRLTELAELPLPNVTEFTGDPIAPDVEWFFTNRELCQLMGRVADLPLMSVNPGGGLVNLNDWAKVSFKGGSEPGVLNLTTWLVGKDGQTYCVSATWNNPNTTLDDGRFFALYGGIIAGLK